MIRYWILDGHQPVPVDDVRTWGLWFQDITKRRVDYTEFPGGYVSTVFLGLNHRFGPGKPLLFETMVFGGPHDELCDRYETWEEAEAGHRRAVELATSVDAVDPSAADPGTLSTREEKL